MSKITLCSNCKFLPFFEHLLTLDFGARRCKKSEILTPAGVEQFYRNQDYS